MAPIREVCSKLGLGASRRVYPLELFFDLVFVFALTQVTGFLLANPTWAGMLQCGACSPRYVGVGGYAWLTKRRAAEEVIPARLVIFGAIGCLVRAALAVPGAFGR